MSGEEVGALVSIVRRRAQTGGVVGKRDYALLLMYLATGLRRQEAIGLRGKDVHLGETFVLEYRAKGGDYRSREVKEPQVLEALVDYLTTAGRLHALKTDAPLWTRHDRAGKPGEVLTSHCFVKNLKLESAMAMPRASFGEAYLHEDLAHMAAAYAFHVAQNQPFLGGNKRRGLVAALVFLDLNGVTVLDPQERLFDVMIAVADRRMDKDGLAGFLRELSDQG